MRLRRPRAALLLLCLLAAGCTVADRLNIPVPQVLNRQPPAPPNEKPGFVHSIVRTSYDGVSDDLLTAGLGKTGLGSDQTPAFADPLRPTAAELRRRAIHTNYRAAHDMQEAGGYGRLHGPNVDGNGQVQPGEGLIAGVEYLAFADDGSGQKNVTLMVQIPARFNSARPCLVAAPSSGSRGVYGAIGMAGEWGLKKGCAVAYTDKGTGPGAHDLSRDRVIGLQGEVLEGQGKARSAQFVADLLPGRRSAWAAEHPGRHAIKHAHSQQNPEKDWGRDVLAAIRFGLWAMNEELVTPNEQGFKPVRLTAQNTLVMAAGVSNGGGAVLRAAELDLAGLIDGVVASEPQVQPAMTRMIRIEQGSRPIERFGLPLFDYITLANLYQPCAAYAPSLSSAPGLALIPPPRAAGRCQALRAAGLLKTDTPPAQAEEALALLHQSGWLPESDILIASHYALATPGIAVNYAMSYARASVVDELCGFGYAGAALPAGKPVQAPPEVLAGMHGNSSGIVPTSGLAIINEADPNGPTVDALSVSASTRRQDLNADGALCLRALLQAQGAAGSTALRQRQGLDLRRGLEEVRASANLHGKPAIIVHGRSDALVPVNHSSRPYFALNQAIEGADSRLRYIEVTHAHHFDGLNGHPAFAGLATRFVPLHPYFLQALDNLYEHLSGRKPLPDSQVVRTQPRRIDKEQLQRLDARHVPAYPLEARGGNRIVFTGQTLLIAD